MTGDRGLIAEELHAFFATHAEDVGNIVIFERDVEGVSVVTSALAYLARHVHVGEEMHFDLDSAVARTRFTSATRNIERKTTRQIATNF